MLARSSAGMRDVEAGMLFVPIVEQLGRPEQGELSLMSYARRERQGLLTPADPALPAQLCRSHRLGRRWADRAAHPRNAAGVARKLMAMRL